MSFSCPHFDPDHDACRLLKTDCVPGRRGCVLKGSVFAVPVEQRLKEREEENRQRAIQAMFDAAKKPVAGESGR
ncbi:MAG: hypothetical protein KA257_14715 [Opitutaceae bacterium]|nr:hypothetical protein [Opitutaceae bacterium]MBP9902901.1 hypothetical protein [Verrucomicrobiota bacterium]